MTGENVFYSVIIENRKTQLIKIFTVKIQTACVFFSRAFFYIDLKIIINKNQNVMREFQRFSNNLSKFINGGNMYKVYITSEVDQTK